MEPTFKRKIEEIFWDLIPKILNVIKLGPLMEYLDFCYEFLS